MVFSETKNNSLTPASASQLASAKTSSGVRETNAPRKLGIAQKAQRRSQPEAIFSGAHGAEFNLARAKSLSIFRSAGAIGNNFRRSLGV